MSASERFSLATHLYVRLRRSCGRVVDAVWMAQNDDYARAILRLAADQNDAEIQALVDKFQALLGDRPQRKPASPQPVRAKPEPEAAQHYIGALR